MVDIAKKKASTKAVNINHILATAQIPLGNQRNIEVPSLLQVYCNMMELMRLRHEIILAVSECKALAKVYEKQIQACRKSDAKVELPDSISFEQLEQQDDDVGDLINYLDDGPAHQINLGLDIREYDPTLLSNLNFRAPDSFKLCITTSGLEEVRAVLRYQLM